MKNKINLLEELGEILNTQFVQIKQNLIVEQYFTKVALFSVDTNNHVTGLSIQNFGLEVIPKLVLEFPRIIYLNLSRNKIRGILPLEKLLELCELHLEDNQIDDISSLQKFRSLRKINLNQNRITDISVFENIHLPDINFNDKQEYESTGKITLIDLENINISRNTTGLSQISLQKNQIENILPLIKFFKNYISIYIDENPIKAPPMDIVSSGYEAILRWHELREKEITFVKLNEIKIIFIGDGLVGKTSIIRKLLERSSQLPQFYERTQNIDIHSWYPFQNDSEESFQNFKANIWDFGGQGKYRDIQQFFCTKRALYIFVDAIKDPILSQYCAVDLPYHGFDYWVKFVELFGCDHENAIESPIIYVINKIDLIDKPISEVEIVNKYRNTGFTKISCLLNKELLRKKFDLFEMEIKEKIKHVSHDIFDQEYPYNWIRVKNILEELRGTDINYINMQEYLNICKKNGLTIPNHSNKSQAYLSDSDLWLNILNMIGTILYFPNIELLNDIIIINPNWIKNSALKLLDYDKIASNGGFFNKVDFKYIWEDINNKDHNKFIELAMAFKLCYESDGKYYVPALLPDIPQRINNYLGFSRYLIEYNYFMPAGVIGRIIVKWNPDIKDGRVWLSGCVLEIDETTVEIIENWQKKYLQISLKGSGTEDLYEDIKDFVKSINNDFIRNQNKNILQTREYILCNCIQCINNLSPQKYSSNVKAAVCILSKETVVFDKKSITLSPRVKVFGSDNIVIQNINKSAVSIQINQKDKIEEIDYVINEYESMNKALFSEILQELRAVREILGASFDFESLLKNINQYRDEFRHQ